MRRWDASRVVHVSTAHRAFDTRIFHKECRTLEAAGYEVHLVVPHARDELVDRVHIHALPRRTSRADRLLRSPWMALSQVRGIDARCVHLHDPELMILVPWLKATGHTVVLDSHEDQPRLALSREWVPRWLRPMLSRAVGLCERVMVSGVDAVVSAEERGAERFPPSKTVTVRNFPRLEEFDVPVGVPYQSREPVVVYVGDISRTRGALQMVEAMSLVDDPDARLMLAGRIAESKLEDELRASPGWSRTEFVGWLDRPGIVDLLGRARVGLVVLQPTNNYVVSQPVKLFEYLAAGLPVVASEFDAWRPYVCGPEAGVPVDPTSPRAIASALSDLLGNTAKAGCMGERGRDAVRGTYNWGVEGERLVELYGRLLGPPVLDE